MLLPEVISDRVDCATDVVPSDTTRYGPLHQMDLAEDAGLDDQYNCVVDRIVSAGLRDEGELSYNVRCLKMSLRMIPGFHSQPSPIIL